tara:strand:+ start:202 stop:1143 length:942 start_codon:yes stop_codon:yes gene_type:complete
MQRLAILQGVVFLYTSYMSLPEDRGHIETEQPNSATTELDLHSTQECVEIFANDHLQAVTAVQNASTSIAAFIEHTVTKVKQGGRLIYIGCGTSGRLGVLDAAECPPTFQSDPNQVIGIIAGGDAALRVSSEGMEDLTHGITPDFDRIQLQAKDVVLGIAAGGTTPWVLGGLEIANKFGASTGFLTCSKVKANVNYYIQLETGPEPLTGSTRMKAGTATKLVLNIITTTLFTKLGKVYGNTMVDLKASNLKLLDRAIRIVASICKLDRKKALELLTAANNDVKVAIVMHMHGVEQESAKETLDSAGGDLRTAL